ncbi:alpha/beta fold hydrolase [Blastomonas sp.]|uniref:alpha/beta fold hydrolase n=1 Tax=Blastomonas sp. TaxID=1909299 RepID=UPI002602BFD1|nr:alpha/beta fold hydrolase [Blastomonas sp.]MDM7954782.1 alpha/beta fold hydrolase [Blastomonas sp.]
MRSKLFGLLLACSVLGAPAFAQSAPAPAATPGSTPGPATGTGAVDYAAQLKQGDAILKDFSFGTGETMAELRMHYATLGTPRRDAQGRVTNAVMVLHGTGGSGLQFLQPQFAQELFGPGQPLDITRYYVILPDNIGHGKSSKPSDGLKMQFPAYDYTDMVKAQRRMLVEGLKVDRLRLVMGTSMGCMHGFVWGQVDPGFVQAMMPMACLPMPIAGHNRMWRKAAVEGIKADPVWAGGDYTAPPVMGLRVAASLLQVAGFAPLYLQKAFPTRDAADAYITQRIEASIKGIDANDIIYQVESSRNYDPSASVEQMTMPVTWINSSDDFINPWDYGVAEDFGERLPDGKYLLIKATDDTRGHSTHTWAKFWTDELVALLARSGR